MHDYSDAIVVKMTGGIGNQLFGLAAGLNQARRLDCRLVLDASSFGRSEIRRFELDGLGFEVVRSYEPQSKLQNKFLSLVKPKSLDRLAVFRETGFNYDASINLVSPGTLLTGYFQSFRYFSEVAEDLIRIFEYTIPTMAPTTSTTSTTKSPKNISMHVRRGDYLDEKTRTFHGLATNNYFNRSLDLLASSLENGKVNIYSDSPEHIQLSDYNTNFDLSLVDDSDLGTLETIKAMSRADAFIMSNSSFSWWGAWLMRVRGGKGLVIAPRPWFAAGASAHDLLMPDWITLDAR